MREPRPDPPSSMSAPSGGGTSTAGDAGAPPTSGGTGAGGIGHAADPGPPRRGDGRPHSPPHRRRLAVLAGGVGCFLLFQLATLAPGVVEAVYGRRVGPAMAWLLSRVTGVAPFPLAEVVVTGYLAWLAVAAWRAVGQVRRGDRRLRGALAGAGSRLARDAGAALVLFYLLWGFHYARPPLEARLGLPDGGGADTDELARLATDALDATNAAYRAVHDGADAASYRDAGADDTSEGRADSTPAAATAFPGDAGTLEEALREGWQRAVEETDLAPAAGWRYGPVKHFVPDGLLARVGLSGFYFPWTGEAVVDGGAPAAGRLASAAHETAHQRGVGPEDEASFAGFLAASRAPDPVVRYSAFLFAQRFLVAEVARRDRQRARELAALRLPGVRRDLEELYAYHRRMRVDRVADAARNVNDAYLKSQRVEGGVTSYGRVTRLLVAWGRDRGGLGPGGGDAGATPGGGD